MSEPEPCIAVLATGKGRGAVATVLVVGASALDLIQACFHSFRGKRKPAWKLDTPYFGQWTWGRYQEELVVCRTDKQSFEVHCHGGQLAAQSILDSLRQSDAVILSQDEWLSRSEPDRFVRQAKTRLIEARTERVSSILIDQLRGALRAELLRISSLVQENKLADALSLVRRLLALGELGVRLHRPFSVVLVGFPNTGKSSLINAMVGFERSVVFDQPGTTRDLVRVETGLKGWSIRLTDTAGIRHSLDAIEQQGMELAQETLRSADLAIVVSDLTAGSDSASSDLGLKLPRKIIRVGTKSDLAASEARSVDIVTSSVTGHGIDALNEQIVSALVPVAPKSGEAMPLDQGTIVELETVSRYLKVEDSGNAQMSLRRLLSSEPQRSDLTQRE